MDICFLDLTSLFLKIFQFCLFMKVRNNIMHVVAVLLTRWMYKLLKIILRPPNDIGPIKV